MNGFLLPPIIAQHTSRLWFLSTFLDQVSIQVLLVLVRCSTMIAFEYWFSDRYSTGPVRILKNINIKRPFWSCKMWNKLQIPSPNDASWEASTLWISIRWRFRLHLCLNRRLHRRQGKDGSVRHSTVKWYTKLGLCLYLRSHWSHLYWCVLGRSLNPENINALVRLDIKKNLNIFSYQLHNCRVFDQLHGEH